MNRFKDRDVRLCADAARILILAAVVLLCPLQVSAAGSGLNVLVVANQASSNSLELANYYRLKRQVPPEHFLRISWTSTNVVEWTRQDFTNTLLNPLLAFIAQNQLSQQIHYVVLSMDLPYRVTGTQDNSTTAALFYGFKTNSAGYNNSYSLSEERFTASEPDTAPTNSFLTMMLTADSLDEAKAIINQGVASDYTYPTQKSWLVKSTDIDRNKRYKAFDNAIFNTRLCDRYSLLRTNIDSAPPWTNLLGFQLGLQSFIVVSNAFVPGAIADNMTSFGGQIFEDPGQTTLLEFINAGASGSYGTVAEPLANVVRFPDPMVYFYQSRGFTLAECYYQSVQQPFQGLFVGEPLAAPCRRKSYGGWSGISTNSVLTGTTNLALSFTSEQTNCPTERIDLFVDGGYSQTLTSVSPQPGNRLSVRLNGYPVNYDVPTNATLRSIAAGLAAELNNPANTNITEVVATAIGDRIQLQSLAEPLPEGVFQVVDDEATFLEPREYLAAPRDYSRASTVSALGMDSNGDFKLGFATDPGVSNLLQASTNLFDWITIHTNAMGGTAEFIDTDTLIYPYRFYRVVVDSPKPTPQLRAVGVNASNQFLVEVTFPTNFPYLVQASSDLDSWSDIATNDFGGDSWLLDEAYGTEPIRYYRTRSGDTNDYSQVSVVDQTPTGGNILHVQDNSPGDIVVWASTNGLDWTPIYTYKGSPDVQTEAGSASGTGEPLTTYLRASRPEFVDSTAQGIREFGVELDIFGGHSTLSSNSYLTLQVTKTNESMVMLTVTNPPGNLDMKIFVQTLVDAINLHPDLTSIDGVEADDVTEFLPDTFSLFNLYARAQGQAASEVRAHLSGSSDLVFWHLTSTDALVAHMSPIELNQNNSDLLPRNHLYVCAGVPYLGHSFDLDTTTLPDGYHDLIAVAYEGTHVYSQTLKTVPVIVSNTPLQATLALQSAGATNLVSSSFDFEVIVNTNSVDEIRLFTTAGLYDSRTNQQMATFTVNGMDLGVGEHPFYALITTTNGPSYRTQKVNVTLTR